MYVSEEELTEYAGRLALHLGLLERHHAALPGQITGQIADTLRVLAVHQPEGMALDSATLRWVADRLLDAPPYLEVRDTIPDAGT